MIYPSVIPEGMERINAALKTRTLELARKLSIDESEWGEREIRAHFERSRFDVSEITFMELGALALSLGWEVVEVVPFDRINGEVAIFAGGDKIASRPSKAEILRQLFRSHRDPNLYDLR